MVLVRKRNRLRTGNAGVGEIGRTLKLQRRPQKAYHQDQSAQDRCLCNRIGTAMEYLRHLWKLSITYLPGRSLG